jgi:hypothetical protein
MNSAGKESLLSDLDTQLIQLNDLPTPGENQAHTAVEQQRAMTEPEATPDRLVESTFQQTTSNPNPSYPAHANPASIGFNSIITRNADQIRVIKVNRQIQDVKFCSNSIR